MAVICAALAATAGLQASGTVQQILTNGPAAQRLNIVFLSEGYTEDELARFPSDALEVLNALLNAQPYREYRSYFNAFTISVASAESGSDHPSRGVLRNTYFNSSFDSYGLQRLITIPPNDRNANYADGQGKIDDLLEALIPEYDISILIVNDQEYGGSGGVTPITSRSADSPQIIIHELGHSLAGLGDEYALPFPGYPDVEEPNTTTETNRLKIKWNAWILPETPIPTPDSDTEHIGLFEGAHYHASGWYRPKFACKMRDLRFPLCEVCQETILKAAYRLLRSIESFSPAATNLALSLSGQLPFQAEVLAPITHALSVQWFTNGVAVPGAVSDHFLLSGSQLGSGTHDVRVKVTDHSPIVRTDPDHLLTDSVAWKVAVNSAPFTLRAIPPPAQDSIHFLLIGPANAAFAIQTSMDLIQWSPILTNRLTADPFDFTEPPGFRAQARYFRAIWLPD